MKTGLLLCLVGMVFLVILHGSYAPPVTPEKKEGESEVKENLEDYIEYQRYLQEVVQALESDPEFRERLEKADEEDVRSGKIAEHLDFVNHNVRTKLDEIKRREMERLRHLAKKQYELVHDNEVDPDPSHRAPADHHLDHSNPHTFEIEDLKKLIKQTTADLEAADKQRREEFKEYEMKKEFEKHQKLESMDETHKAEYEAQLKKEQEALKHHKPIHHPGSKQQLEEVWEKQDHMDQQFDPKAFFMMHVEESYTSNVQNDTGRNFTPNASYNAESDFETIGDVDGNGVWDADEVKALFVKELDKLYGPGGPNKDLHERAEEMERMREHVFQENDRNRDGLIDFHEFMMETQRADFNQDDGWKSIDENQIYTPNEYQEFERRQLEELRYLQSLGLVDAHGRPIPGAEHQIHKASRQFQAQYHPIQYQPLPPGHPQAHPGQFQQQPPQYQPIQQGQYQGQGQYQPPQGQPVPGQYQAPQGQAPPSNIPQGNIPQGYAPQGQGQLAQGQINQGIPPQNYGQAPQGQIPQGQVVQESQGQGQQQQGQQGQGQQRQGQQQGQQQQQGQGQQQQQGQGQQGQGYQGQQAQGQQGQQAQGQQGQQAQGQQGQQGQQAQGQQGQQGQGYQGQQGQGYQGQQGQGYQAQQGQGYQAHQGQAPQGPGYQGQPQPQHLDRVPGDIHMEPGYNNMPPSVAH